MNRTYGQQGSFKKKKIARKFILFIRKTKTADISGVHKEGKKEGRCREINAHKSVLR